MGVNKVKQIVLFGPDCSGKTELSTRLAAHYVMAATPNRRIQDDLSAAAHVLNYVKKFMVEEPKDLLLDQWQYPVDIIYNRVLRGKSSPMLTIEPLILPHLNNVVFIHLDAREDVLRKRFSVRGDELWSIEQIIKVAAAYRTYTRIAPMVVNTIDTSDITPEEVLNRAVEIIDAFYKEETK